VSAPRLSLPTWFDRVDVDDVPVGRRTLVHVPDTATALVFRTTAERRSDLFVIGPRTHGSYHPAKALTVCIRMRVRPAWSRTLLGVEVQDLVDRATPLSDLWGTDADRLAEEMAEAGDRAFARLASALRDHGGAVPVSPSRSRLLSSAMSALAPRLRSFEDVSSPGRGRGSGPGPALGAGAGAGAGAGLGVERDSVGVVAERLGVSERHLRNVFRRELGISPKHFARIARLRHVLSLAGRRQWASVAGDAGFFDQAHMIADFRALMGVSPGAYLAGRLPTPSACS
jgi:AraC-like DNA-binding protein